MRCSARELHECARHSHALGIAHAECDFASDDIEGFVPGVVVWRRTAPFEPHLQKYLVAAGLGCGREQRNVLADDVEGLRAALG